MNVSRFFVDRPIFAAVLSLLITIGGALSLFVLPVSEYPSVVPPTVVVRGTYPGANPKTIAETVAAPLEQQLNGVEGMLYMFSQATSDGLLTLTIKDKSALYLAYMPFIRNGGLFIPTNSSYKLGDEVFMLGRPLGA